MVPLTRIAFLYIKRCGQKCKFCLDEVVDFKNCSSYNRLLRANFLEEILREFLEEKLLGEILGEVLGEILEGLLANF